MASRWETVVISSSGPSGDHYEVSVLDLNRQAIGRTAILALHSIRERNIGDAVGRLFGVVDRMVATFPAADRMLIVPVGVCALLPYNAGRTKSGSPLIEASVVTQAPSLGWALSCRRPRPADRVIGVFHPGHPPLDLEKDRASLADLYPGAEILDKPKRDQLLDLLREPRSLMHFSGHGHYDFLDPLRIGIQLDDVRTVAQVVESGSVAWFVNLSACETAIPDFTRIEQDISLPTAFLRSGSSHVIATLWNIGNRCATVLNANLYGGFGEHEHPVRPVLRSGGGT